MTTTLDCETPVGREYIRHETDIAEDLENIWSGSMISLGKSSRVDRLLIDPITKSVRAAIEIRSRNETLNELSNYGTIFISAEKWTEMQVLCMSLNIPSVFVVKSIPDCAMLWCHLHDRHGSPISRSRVQRRRVQKSCNGGITDKIMREIDIRDFQRI